jgi:peroxiredoxin
MTAAVQFGLTWQVPESMVERYTTYGIDLDAASGRAHHILPVPAVFVVGTDGVVRFQYINPDHRVRLDADVLLAAAKAQMARMSRSESSE